jgi:hypothetical protein
MPHGMESGDVPRVCGSGGKRVTDQFDVSLEDSELMGEVELTTNLIIAASESEERLTPEEIDQILGVETAPGD